MTEPTAAGASAGAYILDQYLCDFSIENPGGRVAPEQAGALSLGLDANVATAALPEAGHYAVQIALGMPARLGERVIFLIELRYRVNVQVQGVDDDALPELLNVRIPAAVFPTLKEIVEKNGAFAGYPEIELHPIDFASFFATQRQARQTH